SGGAYNFYGGPGCSGCCGWEHNCYTQCGGSFGYRGLYGPGRGYYSVDHPSNVILFCNYWYLGPVFGEFYQTSIFTLIKLEGFAKGGKWLAPMVTDLWFSCSHCACTNVPEICISPMEKHNRKKFSDPDPAETRPSGFCDHEIFEPASGFRLWFDATPGCVSLARGYS